MLSGTLGQGRSLKTSPRLYDRFPGFSERYTFKGTADLQEMTIVRLPLDHPTRPDAKRAILFLRRLSENKTVEQAQAFMPPHATAKEMFRGTFDMAINVAKVQNLHEDVLWLEEKRWQIFPLNFRRVAR